MAETVNITYSGADDAVNYDLAEYGSPALKHGDVREVPRELAERLVDSGGGWQLDGYDPQDRGADGAGLDEKTVKELDALAEELQLADYPKSGSKPEKLAALRAAPTHEEG